MVVVCLAGGGADGLGWVSWGGEGGNGEGGGRTWWEVREGMVK